MRSLFSNTVTSWPARASCCAAARPAGPLPTTATRLPLGATGGSYKELANVERAFRSLKSVDLKIRPIHHHLEERVGAHVFLCMLAYYVERHMRQAQAPMLFDDDEPAAGEALRTSIVAPAQRSPSAQDKAQSKGTADGMPVHSFQTPLQDLRTVTLNTVQMGEETCQMVTAPTPVQQRAFDLLKSEERRVGKECRSR